MTESSLEHNSGHQAKHGAIARRAYQLFEARGGEPGRDVEDWLAAEQEFDQEAGGEAPEYAEVIPLSGESDPPAEDTTEPTDAGSATGASLTS